MGTTQTTASSAGETPSLTRLVLTNGTTVFGVVLAGVHGVIITYFFGAVWGAAWSAVSIGLLIGVVVNAIKATMGDKGAATRFNIAQLVLVTLWMASAIAIWMTGSKAAWVIAITVPASWAIHIIFAGKGNLKAVLRLLAICTVPMMRSLKPPSSS